MGATEYICETFDDGGGKGEYVVVTSSSCPGLVAEGSDWLEAIREFKRLKGMFTEGEIAAHRAFLETVGSGGGG